jgi:hypothetical protein
MALMKGLMMLVAIAALSLAACSNVDTSRQWYKPNVSYTAAEFDRDQAVCTDKKTKVLDEDCMKERGWVALGGDIGPAVKAPDPSAGKTKGKY